MCNQLTTFSAIKSFYDAKNDLLDIICNFILSKLQEEKNTRENIRDALNKEYRLNIPVDVIKSALKRLKKSGAIEDTSFGIYLTESGNKEKITLRHQIDEAKSDFTCILSDLQKFIQLKIGMDNKPELSKLAIELKEFITNHPIIIAVNKLNFPEDSKIKKQKSLIGEYIFEKENNDPINFKRLKSIFYGYILASILETDPILDNKKIKKLDVYLDSNIVFSLLGLDDDQYNKSAKEMLEVLKNNKVDLKIFTFTIDEVKTKLQLYPEKFDNYISGFPVDSIYYKMKSLGMKKTDASLLIADLENRLEKMGICVDFINSVEKIEKEDEALIEKLKIEKERKNPGSIKHISPIEHDILAIKTTKKMRGSYVYRIEDSKKIFLTADYTLAKFDNEELQHKEKTTVPEVLYRSHLVSFLWLKNPGMVIDLPIHDLLNGYIKTKLIGQNLWEIFIQETNKLLNSGKYSSESLAALISLEETRNILFDIQDTPVQKYAEAIREKIFSAESIQYAEDKLKKNAILKKSIEEAEQMLKITKKDLESQTKELETKKTELFQSNEKLKKIEQSIRERCTKIWRTIINSIISIFLIAVFLCFLAILFTKNIEFVDTLASLIAISLVFIPLVGFLVLLMIKSKYTIKSFFLEKKENLENFLIERCIKRKKKYLNL